MAQNELMRAFGFTKKELKLNERGELSPRQQKTLEENKKGRQFGTNCAKLMFLLTLIPIIIVFVAARIWEDLNNLIGFFIFLGIFFSIMIFFFYKGIAKDKELDSGIIHSVEGVVELEKKEYKHKGSSLGYQYRINVGELRIISASKKQYDAFEERKKYKIHFVGSLKATHNVVLSAEIIEII